MSKWIQKLILAVVAQLPVYKEVKPPLAWCVATAHTVDTMLTIHTATAANVQIITPPFHPGNGERTSGFDGCGSEVGNL
jgi:hypothetical protein